MSDKIKDALSAQAELVASLRREVEIEITDEMGELHNNFVAIISASKIPLPHVSLVLDMLKRETIEQAFKKYLGE